MAPEQFHGKAVLASDVYSIGVTMYQMLTGTLPYATPSPADLERLMKGELVSSPRLRNPKIPKGLSDIVLKALAPALTVRYSRPSEVLDDVLAARETVQRPRRAESRRDDSVADIQSRLRARDTPQPSFCWHCRKPLQARTAKCPFCGETQ
jgi:serine/threonine protein kinase